MPTQSFHGEPAGYGHTGFTLVELIVTLSLAAILLTIAIPNFQALIRSNRLTATTNEFVAFFNLTRSEAIRRGSSVSLCKTANGAACTTTGGWEAGWLVFADPNANGVVDGGEELIRVHEALDGQSTLVSSSGTAGSLISFNGSGFVSQSGTLALCSSSQCFNLIITSPGRIRSERVP
jgi:type IV fimbrial biogenesis protein FimT